jgi:thiol-disulfide isomerase/thioredoxin
VNDREQEKGELIEFYGKECPHCQAMEPLIERLAEEGFEVSRKEV